MVVQMLAKARACAEWNVPMVWVVQDAFYNYIVRETRIELKSVPLRKVYNKPPHPILFFVYRVVPDAKENRYSLQLTEVRGGTQEDFEKMLQPGFIPDVTEVAAQIQTRIQSGKAFNLNFEPAPKLGKAVSKIVEGKQNRST
jgi:hypothetical protein